MSTKRGLVLALAATLLATVISNAARADDVKCLDKIAKGARNIANQEQKKNRKCVKDGSGDISTCIATESPKAASKRAKLADVYGLGGKCDPAPAYGFNPSASDVADTTEQAAGDILRRVFGNPTDGIDAGSKCQDKIAQRTGKQFDAELKAFRKCVKDNGSNQAGVDTCVTTGVNDGKAQDVQTKLAADMGGKCDFMPIPAPLGDGDCSTCTDAATCAACIGDIVDCEACRAMVNNGNVSAVDCDMVDDGLSNSSCVTPCPLDAGAYTVTQLEGGGLKVYVFDAFPFPAGGTYVEDVSAGTYPACVHNVAVPFPGGFNVPAFCVPALGLTTKVTQTGCGIGRIDSNGGSDFTIQEDGDTSDSSVTCNLPHPGCPPGPATLGADASIRVDITVGDATADTCTGGGTANAIVTVPVHTISWADNSPGMFAPGCAGDGVFNAGDAVASQFDQILDLTTDTAAGGWVDIDGDGCAVAGGAPGGPFSQTGICINTSQQTLTIVATGEFGSTGGIFDGAFTSSLPSTISSPAAPLGVVCGTAPAINYAGLATRCIP